jgi:hypothetical protein
MARMDMADGGIFFVVSAANVYVSICEEFCDGKWSFGRGGEFFFLLAFLRFLYNKY